MSGSSRRGILLLLGLLLLLTMALRVPLLDIPFERDEGGYSYIAWRLGYHELPYRDWIDHKPPAIYWVYHLALSLPFESIRSVHVMALLFSASSACALFFLASRFVGRPWAAVAAALFALVSTDPLVQGTSANTELFMLLPLILSQLAFLSAASGGRRRILLMIVCGVLSGIAVAFKQVAAVNWLFLIACYFAFATGGRRLRETLSFAAWSTTGLAASWGLMAMYFAFHHALRDFIYWVFTYNLEYADATPWRERLENCAQTLTTLWRTQAGLWILSVAGFAGVWQAGRRKWLLFLGGWLVTSLVGVSASGFFFAHYFQQLLPVLCVTATLGAEVVYRSRFWSGISAWGRGSLLVLLLVLPPATVLFPFLFVYSPAEAFRRIYPGNPFAEMPEMGRRIAEVTQPQDRVFLFAMEAEALFYARRISATRYVNLLPLYSPHHDTREKQLEAAREITLARPAAVFCLPNGLFFRPGTEQYFSGWVETYHGRNFRADTAVAVDPAYHYRLIPIPEDLSIPLSPGERLVGALYVTKTR